MLVVAVQVGLVGWLYWWLLWSQTLGGKIVFGVLMLCNCSVALYASHLMWLYRSISLSIKEQPLSFWKFLNESKCAGTNFWVIQLTLFVLGTPRFLLFFSLLILLNILSIGVNLVRTILRVDN